MTKMKINPDLEDERNKIDFEIEEFTNWYYKGADKVEEKRFLGKFNVFLIIIECSKKLFLENFFLSDPEMSDEIPISYLSHKEKYESAVKRATLVLNKIKELQSQGRAGVDIYMALLGGMLGTALFRESNPITVHFVMFLPAL